MLNEQTDQELAGGQKRGDDQMSPVAGDGQGGQQRNDNHARLAALSDTIAAIQSHHRERLFAQKQQLRLNNAVIAFVRVNVCGWHPDAPDAEERRKQAAAIVDQIEAEYKDALREIVDSTVTKGKRAAKRRPDLRWHAQSLVQQTHPADPEDVAAARPVVAPTIFSRLVWDDTEADHLREMTRLARTLPVYAWCAEVSGLADGKSLAKIVGECGALTQKPDGTPRSVQELRRYMECAPFKGHAGSTWKSETRRPRSLTNDEWIELGYSGRKLAMMRQLSEAMVKNRSQPYRQAYDDRKAYEREKAEAAGLTIKPAAQIKVREKSVCISEGHIHTRALRKVEQDVLKGLWRAWRDTTPQIPAA